MPNAHILYNGRQHDFNVVDDLGLDNPTDNELVAAVANRMDVPVAKLAAFNVQTNQETMDKTLVARFEFGAFGL